MRICDRCNPEKQKKATEKIIIEREGEELDLCQDCLYEVREFAYNRQKRPLLSLKGKKSS